MVRKMAYIGSFYLIGLFFASFFNFEINIAASLAAAVFSAVILSVYKRKYVKSVICVLSLASGMFIYGTYDRVVYQNIIKYYGYNVEVKGVLTDFTEYSGDKSSYTVKGIINGDVQAVVTCYTDSIWGLEIGDKVSLLGKAEIPEDSYVFPTQSYNKAKGIYLRLSRVTNFNYTENTGFSLKKTIYKYRDYISDVIHKYMELESSAVMEAMLFGDKTGIESNEKTLMYRAGIGHIMAVSGVHLSVVCSFFWFVISRLPINKYLRFALLMIPILCFVILAGMSNSVIRAAIMIILVYGAGLFKRRADTFNSLGIAVILLTVFSPFAVRDASFLLSAAGVFGIGVAAPSFIKFVEEKYILDKSMKSLVASACVTVIVFPVTILFFDEVSIISPLSNFILMPICEMILIAGIIVTVTGGIPFIAEPVLKICDWCCQIVIVISKFIGGLDFSYIPLGIDFVRYTVIASLVIIAISFFIHRKTKYAAASAVAVLTIAVLSVNVYRNIPDGKITMAVLKEDSAVTLLIHDKKSASVIDLCKGGKAMDSAVKYLNKNGIYKLDTIIMNVDANTSSVTYNNRMDLFDVSSVFVPENHKKDVKGKIAGSNITYYDNSDAVFEYDDFSINFAENGVITLNCLGSEFIMYNEKSMIDGDTEYTAAIRYSGNECRDANAGIIAAMSDKATVVTDKNNEVYIGKSVKFIISPDRTVTAGEIT